MANTDCIIKVEFDEKTIAALKEMNERFDKLEKEVKDLKMKYLTMR